MRTTERREENIKSTQAPETKFARDEIERHKKPFAAGADDPGLGGSSGRETKLKGAKSPRCVLSLDWFRNKKSVKGRKRY